MNYKKQLQKHVEGVKKKDEKSILFFSGLAILLAFIIYVLSFLYKTILFMGFIGLIVALVLYYKKRKK